MKTLRLKRVVVMLLLCTLTVAGSGHCPLASRAHTQRMRSASASVTVDHVILLSQLVSYYTSDYNRYMLIKNIPDSKMEQEIIDLSHLTEEERAKLMAVIQADEELRLQNLR